jgi:hypothetical protein
MASFDLTRYTTDEYNSVDDCLADIEAQLELVDSTKTIRWIDIVSIGGGQSCVGYCIYDT